MSFDKPSREVRIAVLVTLTHVVAGYLLLRGAGPSFSAVPRTPVWAMSAEMVSDSASDQVRVEATPPVEEVVEPTPSTAPQMPPAESLARPVASLPTIPKNEVPPAMAAVSAEPQGSSGMLKITPIALPDGPPVAFVPPPSMVGVVPASKSQMPCRDLKKVSPQPRDTLQRGPDVPCDE
jgi:hypothetical protein